MVFLQDDSMLSVITNSFSSVMSRHAGVTKFSYPLLADSLSVFMLLEEMFYEEIKGFLLLLLGCMGEECMTFNRILSTSLVLLLRR